MSCTTWSALTGTAATWSAQTSDAETWTDSTSAAEPWRNFVLGAPDCDVVVDHRGVEIYVEGY